MEPNLKFKEYRKSLGLTQIEFADELGVTQGTITDIERGKVNVSKNVKKKIIEKYGAEVGDFTVLNTAKNTVLKEGVERGVKEGLDKENAYYSTLKGENKAIYDTFKLIEKLSTGNLKTAEIQQLAIDEAAKLADKRLYNYLLSTREIINNRSDLNEVRYLVSYFDQALQTVIKVFKNNYDNLLEDEIKAVDYQEFRDKRIENLSKLKHYAAPLKSLHEAMLKFITAFEDIKQKDTGDTKYKAENELFNYSLQQKST